MNDKDKIRTLRLYYKDREVDIRILKDKKAALEAENARMRNAGDLLCDLATKLRAGESTDEEELVYLIAMWKLERAG